ncbi:MAG: hypothetical protein ACXIUL_10695 [Wenzhouxiangella sp.]
MKTPTSFCGLLAIVLLSLSQTAPANSGCASLALSASLTASAQMPAGMPSESASNGTLVRSPLVGCNRALSLHLRDARLTDTHDGQTAEPGQRWLITDIAFENHMPVDLILGLGYQEAALIGSIHRQLYLQLNGRHVIRAAAAEPVELDEGFILPGIGAVVEATVAWPIPSEAIDQLSLHYYHDQYAPIGIALRGRIQPNRSHGPQRQDHDLLGMAIHGVERRDELHGQAAPDNMQWLMVDLRGQGNWTTPADARALDVTAPLDESVALGRVLEYLEAAGLLQVLVDGRHAYTRELSLGSLPQDPAFLPEFEAGGLAVFPIPADAERVELLAQFPMIQGRDISREIRPTLRFTLIDGPVAASPQTVLVEVDDAPTPLQLHAVERLDRFGDIQAGDDETLLLVTASQRNVSDQGGMMQISRRFDFTDEVQIEGLFLRGPLTLAEPYWLPPGDEAREFQLLLRASAALDEIEFEFSGVSGFSRHTLPLD